MLRCGYLLTYIEGIDRGFGQGFDSPYLFGGSGQKENKGKIAMAARPWNEAEREDFSHLANPGLG